MKNSLRVLLVAGGAMLGGLFVLGVADAVPPGSQTEYPVPGPAGGRPGAVAGVMNMWFDGAANQPRAAGDDYPMPVAGTFNAPASGTTNRGTATKANVSVGTTASLLVAAGPARRHIFLQNNSTTATITCTVDGTAPTSLTSGFTVYPMGNTGANGALGSFMPTGELRCIASAAATPAYVSYLQ